MTNKQIQELIDNLESDTTLTEEERNEQFAFSMGFATLLGCNPFDDSDDLYSQLYNSLEYFEKHGKLLNINASTKENTNGV